MVSNDQPLTMPMRGERDHVGLGGRVSLRIHGHREASLVRTRGHPRHPCPAVHALRHRGDPARVGLGEQPAPAGMGGVEQPVHLGSERDVHRVVRHGDLAVEAGRQHRLERKCVGQGVEGRRRRADATQPLTRDPARADPGVADHPVRGVVAHAGAQRQIARADQEMRLELELTRRRGECTLGEIGEPERRIEGRHVILLSAGLDVVGSWVGHGRQRQRRDGLGERHGADRLLTVVDGDRPVAVRVPVGGAPGRPVDGPDPRPWVRRERRRVERRVLDRVAHPDHALLAVRLRVEQRAAVLEPELGVVVVDDRVPDVHVLVHEADVELQRLHDGVDPVALDAHEAAHATRVDRAGAHPLVDRDVVHPVEVAGLEDELRQERPGHDHPGEHRVERDGQELAPGQGVKRRRHAAAAATGTFE